MDDMKMVAEGGGIERLRARLGNRHAQPLAMGALLCLAMFAASVVYLAWGQALRELEVPDLALCGLDVVDCGRWEPVRHVAYPAVEGWGSWYDYTLDSGWSSVGHRVCATRNFPRYSYVVVTELVYGYRTVCKVTDYGPDESLHPDRVIDLSSAAFADLAPISQGVVWVMVESAEGGGI